VHSKKTTLIVCVKKCMCPVHEKFRKKILENLLAHAGVCKYVPSMPMYWPNSLINIERSLMCSGFRFICCVVNSVTVGCRFG
jgi:hypothetical protein